MESVDTAFLPLPEGIVLQTICPTASTVVVWIACTNLVAACPRCQQPSERVHGHYIRTVADLPCGGQHVLLRFAVRKFVCCTLECSQQIFTERRPDFVLSYARMTNRLRDALLAMGMTTGGESGEWLAPKLGMSISAPTLLRHMRQIALPPQEPVHLLGVDDWAWKKGQTYGTILVDLERHVPIDLLPDRTSATTEAWLRSHPEVDLVSRDRGGEYAAAVRARAPQAQQVADKFHLLRNLREALQKLLEHKQSVLPEFPGLPEEDRCQAIPLKAQGSPEELATSPVPQELIPAQHYRQMSAQPRLSPVGLTAAEEYRRIRRDNRYARYEAVRTLFHQGISQREIARRLGLSRETVTHFVQTAVFPEQVSHRAHPRASCLDPFKAYVRHHCQDGCWNGTQLYAEIRAQGFPGSLSLLRHFLTQLRKRQPVVDEGQWTAAPPKNASILDPYKPYVLQRWKEGCWNGVQLYVEIRAQGFSGSLPTLRNFLTDLRRKHYQVGDPTALQWDVAQTTVVLPTSLPPKREVRRRMSPTRASWLLFLPTERLTGQQREQRERLRGCHPEVEAAYQLVSAFVRMLAERRGQDLECWLRQATHSQLPELKRFARGVRRDEAAVRAAVSSGISNGQTEGQVNKLKLLKRSMYGRANFDLLRLRFLYRGCSS